MALRITLLLSVLILGTLDQCRQWRSDVALWSAAVRVSASPRAALNLAIAYRQAGRIEGALWQLQVTAVRARGRGDEARYRAAVARQLAYLELQGVTVCDSPSFQPLCFP